MEQAKILEELAEIQRRIAEYLEILGSDKVLRDLIVKELLDYLDAKVGKGRYVLALTADHGICPLPEVTRQQGHDAGRVPFAPLLRDGLAEATGSSSPFLRIGIGLDATSIAELPRSYSEAVAATEIEAAGHPVAHLASVSVDAWLRHRADATARRLKPAWSGALRDSRLVPTLEAFAAASLNVKACANLLKVHNNTVYHRLNNVRRLTGVDPRTYAGLSHLLAVLSIESRQDL